MELVGHDPHAVLAEAITRGGLHDANSVSDVLRYRIRLLEDGGRTPERAVRDGDWTTFATPWAGPVGAYARVLAAAATARQTELGERAAADPPPWALASSSLGAPPADPRQRGEWVRRAGIVAAYRDLHAIPDGAAVDRGGAQPGPRVPPRPVAPGDHGARSPRRRPGLRHGQRRRAAGDA